MNENVANAENGIDSPFICALAGTNGVKLSA